MQVIHFDFEHDCEEIMHIYVTWAPWTLVGYCVKTRGCDELKEI